MSDLKVSLRITEPIGTESVWKTTPIIAVAMLLGSNRYTHLISAGVHRMALACLKIGPWGEFDNKFLVLLVFTLSPRGRVGHGSGRGGPARPSPRLRLDSPGGRVKYGSYFRTAP
jgi:hypothetical protein